MNGCTVIKTRRLTRSNCDVKRIVKSSRHNCSLFLRYSVDALAQDIFKNYSSFISNCICTRILKKSIKTIFWSNSFSIRVSIIAAILVKVLEIFIQFLFCAFYTMNDFQKYFLQWAVECWKIWKCLSNFDFMFFIL